MTARSDSDDSFIEHHQYVGNMQHRQEISFGQNNSNLSATKRADLLFQLNDFSLDEKELLRSCWHHLAKHKEDVAVEIFILIFKQCPETKKLFYFVDNDQPNVSSKRMKDDNALQFHALRFIQVPSSCFLLASASPF